MKYVILILLLLAGSAQAATFGSVTDTVQDSTSNTGLAYSRMNSKTSGFGPEAGGSYIHVAGAGETVTSFSIFAQGDGGDNDTLVMAIYDITSGDTTFVDSLRCGVASAAPAWNTSETGAIALTSGNSYTVAIGNEVGYVQYYYRPESAGSSRQANITLTTTWVHDLASGLAVYVYATYTVDEAGKQTSVHGPGATGSVGSVGGGSVVH